MPQVIADRVKENVAVSGVGDVQLGGAVSGFQTWSSVCTVAQTAWYVIYDPTSGQWEVGSGTYLAGNKLQRTTVLDSSNGGSLVTFEGNFCDVFMDVPSVVFQGAPWLSTDGGQLHGLLQILSGGLSINGGGLSVFAGDANIYNNATIYSTLTVFGDVAFSGGTFDLNDDAIINGDVTQNGIYTQVGTLDLTSSVVLGLTLADLPTSVTMKESAVPFVGKPLAGVAGEVEICFAMDTWIPANWNGTVSIWKANATNPASFVVSERAVSGGTLTVLGTIVQQASGSLTLPTMATHLIPKTHSLVLTPPTTQDATLSDGCITFLFGKA